MLRWFYYQISDVKAMEAELNRLAGEGWALDWLCFGLARFRRTERADLRYCVEPDHKLPVEREEEEYLQLCADAGWEPVTSNEIYRIFASRPGTNPAPLQTDPAVEFEVNWNQKLKEVALGSLSPVLVILFTRAIHLFTQEGHHLWYPLLSWGTLAVDGLLVLLLLFWLGQFFYLLHCRRQFRAAAEAGEDLPLPSRRGAKLRGLMGLEWLLLLACIPLALFGIGSGGQSWTNTPEVTEHMAELPGIRAEDVGLTPGESHGHLSASGTPFLREVYTLDWDEQSRDLTTQWYDCPADWLARVVVSDLCADFQKGERLLSARILPGTAQILEPADLGFDQSWLASLKNGYQLLLFQEGRIVAYVIAPVDFTDPAVLDAVRTRLLEVSLP